MLKATLVAAMALAVPLSLGVIGLYFKTLFGGFGIVLAAATLLLFVWFIASCDDGDWND